MAGNIGSWRVLGNCGMRRVRTFYYPDADLMPGAEHGDFVYELTRGDWSRQGKDEPSEHAESRVGRDSPGSSAAWIRSKGQSLRRPGLPKTSAAGAEHDHERKISYARTFLS